MSTREKSTERIHLRVTPTTRKKLEEASQKSKLSLSRTIECLIEGHPLREAPPIDYWNLREDIRRVGHNLNQLAHLAHICGDTHALDYKRIEKELQKTNLDIRKAFECR